MALQMGFPGFITPISGDITGRGPTLYGCFNTPLETHPEKNMFPFMNGGNCSRGVLQGCVVTFVGLCGV